MKARIEPVAIAAPALRAAPIRRVAVNATRQPAAAAIAAVSSVDALSETMTSIADGSPRQERRAASMVASSRGSSAASL